MSIKRLKIGQKVWFMREFPICETIVEIDLDENEVWLSDGNSHSPQSLYSSEYKCKKDN